KCPISATIHSLDPLQIQPLTATRGEEKGMCSQIWQRVQPITEIHADLINHEILHESYSGQDEEGHEAELLCFKIKAYLEELFFDSHLAEDGFILKDVQKNKQGYVSLTCLKKVKGISLLASFLSEAVTTFLKSPLPKRLLCSSTNNSALMAAFLQSGSCIPAKSFLRICSAVVRYNSLEARRSKWKGMCVVPLGFQTIHHVTKDDSSEEKNENQPEDTPSQQNLFGTSEDSVQEEPVSVSDETPDTSQPQTTFNNSFQRTFEQTPTSFNSFPGLNKRHNRRSWCSGDCNRESSPSPWTLRHKFAASGLNHKVVGHLNAPCVVQRVLCRPLGPDGTRGFQGRWKLLKQEDHL
uniref:HTH La-type RNA-binding domain-containing protein n=1 Tax=Monopterus albus TaxID=43700 RepID=A0A3Q3K4B0_MONAL